MRIVHINATDARGGAAIACSRFNEALKRAGMQSEMIVANHPQGFDRIRRSLSFRINLPRESKLCATANFSLMDFGLPLHRNRAVLEADIIYLHWINSNTLSIEGVERILKLGKPTFWFMHDMFPFTGGCHYALGCEGYFKQCEQCPQVLNPQYCDIAFRQLKKKLKHWASYKNLEFVSPSEWEADCARKSTLCAGHNVYVASNILNTQIYKALGSSTKHIFGLDSYKKTILFGATRVKSPYKGANFAHECLSMLNPAEYEGLVIGNADKSFISDLPIKIVQTGFLSDDQSIVNAYNACDTFLMSSVAESFGQVVAEAMACGKPCVGFPTGGVLDLIKHTQSGYLTETYSAEELKCGIEWLFSDKQRYDALSIAAQKQIENNNSYQRVIDIHSELHPYIDYGQNQ